MLFGTVAKPCRIFDVSEIPIGTCVRQVAQFGLQSNERDPCLFASQKLDICFGAHVDDMLAVGPSVMTKTLLQKLAKDMAMRWVMANEEPQEFLCQSLSKTSQGYNFGISCDYLKLLYKDFGLR